MISSNQAATCHPCTEVFNGNGAIHNAVSLPGIDAWISSDPFHGDEGGGDVHYVSKCGDGRISRFAVLDVAGHGATVSQVTRRLRSLMRKHVDTLDQAELARLLNQDLLTDGDSGGQFATALLTTYYAPTSHLIICNAGHPRPALYRAAQRTWHLLDEGVPRGAQSLRNLPLGILERAHYEQFAVGLEEDDLVLLYTDSLIEARDASRRRLGEHGLLELVAKLDSLPPQDFNDAVLRTVAEFHGGSPAQDDETLLVLRRNAANTSATAA